MQRANNESKPASVNFSVDLIRCIAIILVIMVHTSGFPYRFPNDVVSSLDIVNWFSTNVYDAIAMVGVPLFVMLTGALLLNPDKVDEPLRVFYKKRFTRIGIPFIFWTLVYFVWFFNVRQNPVTLFNIEQGLLGGSYPILWYMYLLFGLYSVTPILRVLVKHLNRQLFAYLLILWFTGTVVTPFIHTFTSFSFNPVMFVFFDWVGYFLLGIFLVNSKVRKSTAYTAAILGILGAVLGDWAIAAISGPQHIGYFHGYMSFNIIIGSAAFFFLLLSIQPTKVTSHSKINRMVHWISQNTLPIYLIHIIVLETFMLGLLGDIVLNRLTWNLLIDIPVFTMIVFGISAALVYLLKKIPYVAKLIG